MKAELKQNTTKQVKKWEKDAKIYDEYQLNNTADQSKVELIKYLAKKYKKAYTTIYAIIKRERKRRNL